MKNSLIDLLKNNIESYPKMISGFFSGRKTEKELTDVTTQPFWYSMTLSKRRLEKKGLTSELEVMPDRTLREGFLTKGMDAEQITNMDYMIYGAKEGFIKKEDKVHESGTLLRKVLTKRTYAKNGKILYKKKDHELCQLSILKSFVKDGKASCPNCGYEGEVSSFSDGCDYCGAHFTVNDFEPKISGFSVEENVQDKIIRTFNTSYKGMLLLNVICLIASGIINYLVFTTRKEINLPFLKLNLGQMSTVYILLVLFGTFSFANAFLVWIPLGIMRHKYVKRYGTVFDNVDTVKNLYSNFSPADFSQKLECKLKNIILADSANEVAPFATIDFGNKLNTYKDVIDCNLISFKFTDAAKQSKHYYVMGEANVRLFEYKNNKINDRHEKLLVTMQGKEGVVDQPINQLKGYICPNCASSVDLLKGCKCEYCGTEFDYDDFDWMISRLDEGNKPKNILAKVRCLVPIVYLVVFIPFILISSMILSYGGLQTNVVRENDEIVYINEEFFKDKDTYNDLHDFVFNYLVKDYVTEDDVSISAASDYYDDEIFKCGNPGDAIIGIKNRLLQDGYIERHYYDDILCFEKNDVYIDYHSYTIRVQIDKQPEDSKVLSIIVNLIDE